MDGLDWDGTAEMAMNDSASWENPVQENRFISSTDLSGGFGAIINGRKLATVPQDIFNSIQLLQKNNTKTGSLMFRHNSAPGFDHHHQIQAISSWNLAQQTDGFMMNQFSGGLIVSGDSLREAKDGLIRAAEAMESLDCLLSASSSNTENSNSVQEDRDHEFSMILSEHNKNLWNFQPFNNGVSFGESPCNSLINELDETASHNSTGPARKPSNKRTNETLLKTDNSTPVEPTTFQLISDHDQNPPKSKKLRSEKRSNNSSSNTTISFQLQPNNSSSAVSVSGGEPDAEAIAQMKEMIYRAAAFRPVNFGTELMEKPKRKNVRISSDPQTVAARQRRERISERIRVLQKLVPGGNKMDTASMLDEAANYLKFLRSQVKALEAIGSQKNGATNINEAANFSSIQFNHTFPELTSQFPIHTPNSVYLNHPKI